MAKRTRGRLKLGVEAYAEALLFVLKTLAKKLGFDVQDCLLNLTDAREASGGTRRGRAWRRRAAARTADHRPRGLTPTNLALMVQ